MTAEVLESDVRNLARGQGPVVGRRRNRVVGGLGSGSAFICGYVRIRIWPSRVSVFIGGCVLASAVDFRIQGVDTEPGWLIIAAMARPKRREFRVGKIEIIKTIAQRPKGLYRPDRAHQDEKAYSRRKVKEQLKKNLE